MSVTKIDKTASAGYEINESAVVDVSTPVTVDGISVGKTDHWFSIQMFSDAAGTTPATATAGSIAVTAKKYPTNLPETCGDSPLDATDLASGEETGPCTEFTATPTGFTGDAAYYKLVVVSYGN